VPEWELGSMLQDLAYEYRVRTKYTPEFQNMDQQHEEQLRHKRAQNLGLNEPDKEGGK
jgi:hypothetical protein